MVLDLVNKAASNMNWLIYTMYARQEYKFCKEIIAQQLEEENYDQEYLFFIKVSTHTHPQYHVSEHQ